MKISKEKILLYAFCFALIIISSFPVLFKTLFVDQSGKYDIVGPVWALVIVFAIYKKWKHTKLLFNVIFIIALFIEVLILFNISQPYSLNIILLMLAQIGLTLFFNYSIVIQNRFQNKINV